MQHKLVNLTLSSNQVRAQSGEEEREAEAMYHRADNEDDRVLQACLRVRSTANGATGAAAASVVLYTNDRNLANKSIASGIDAYRSASELVKFLDVNKLSCIIDTNLHCKHDSRFLKPKLIAALCP